MIMLINNNNNNNNNEKLPAGEAPYANFNASQAAYRITNLKPGDKVEYKKPSDLSRNLSDLVDLCLNIKPHERPTARQLKQKFDEINN